ncbi:MAG: hypothetical protein NZL96_04025 [Patescibacteria group bacterium]|nr:hypothetical protein [Patescibacteria group bacterium]
MLQKDKMVFLLALALWCFAGAISPIIGQSSTPNNKFGIHLAQPHLEDLPKVKELVNSNGGDWGYVTLVIQENDRHYQKWQEIFNHLRRLHLIPIIRLATQPQDDRWLRPKASEATEWADFLDSLNWVVRHRYIVLFNEPNHGREWGGEVDPKNYAQVAFDFAKELKQKNPDFFIMLAGLDVSAPHQPPQYWEASRFLKEVIQTTPTIFDYLDGWASHSYPNPGFVGSPWQNGRGTIKSYQWELALIRQLGVTKTLPVFIKETGWQHNQDGKSSRGLWPEVVAQNFQIAYQNFWLPDDQVKAVTPFIFDYQSEPFFGFSWKKPGSQDFYPQYQAVVSLPKVRGQPEQLEKGEIITNFSKELTEESNFRFELTLINRGQGYWTDEEYRLICQTLTRDDSKIEVNFDQIGDLMPNQQKKLEFFLKTKTQGQERIKFVLKKNNQEIVASQEMTIKILPLPKLTFYVDYWPFGKGKGEDFEIQIFDWKDQLVYQEKNIKVDNGQGEIKKIPNLSLGELYRVVLLKPGFLPRQHYYVFHPLENHLRFKKLLPFDKNTDGKFSLEDFWFFLRLRSS